MPYTILVVSKRAFLSSSANTHPIAVLFASSDKNIIRAEQECEMFRDNQKGGEKWDFVIAAYPGAVYQGSNIHGWRLNATNYSNDLTYLEYEDLEKFRDSIELTQARMARVLGVTEAAYKRWRTAPNGVPENIAKSVGAHRLLSKRSLRKLISKRER